MGFWGLKDYHMYYMKEVHNFIYLRSSTYETTKNTLGIIHIEENQKTPYFHTRRQTKCNLKKIQSYFHNLKKYTLSLYMFVVYFDFPLTRNSRSIFIQIS